METTSLLFLIVNIVEFILGDNFPKYNKMNTKLFSGRTLQRKRCACVAESLYSE